MIDVHGWVEVSRQDDEVRHEDWAWSGIINISSVIDNPDEVSDALFGWFVNTPEHALAFGRGLPANPSAQVREDIRWIEDHEREHGAGEFFGYTHIDLTEVETFDWQHHGISKPEQSDWWTLLEMVRALRSDQRFKNAGIRIVCWVCR